MESFEYLTSYKILPKLTATLANAKSLLRASGLVVDVVNNQVLRIAVVKPMGPCSQAGMGYDQFAEVKWSEGYKYDSDPESQISDVPCNIALSRSQGCLCRC
jgi:hypothetical protein